jgi:hypothetical protein
VRVFKLREGIYVNIWNIWAFVQNYRRSSIMTGTRRVDPILDPIWAAGLESHGYGRWGATRNAQAAEAARGGDSLAWAELELGSSILRTDCTGTKRTLQGKQLGHQNYLTGDVGDAQLKGAGGGDVATPTRFHGWNQAWGCEQVAPVSSSRPCDAPELLLVDGQVAVGQIDGCGRLGFQRTTLRLEGT